MTNPKKWVQQWVVSVLRSLPRSLQRKSTNVWKNLRKPSINTPQYQMMSGWKLEPKFAKMWKKNSNRNSLYEIHYVSTYSITTRWTWILLNSKYVILKWTVWPDYFFTWMTCFEIACLGSLWTSDLSWKFKHKWEKPSTSIHLGSPSHFNSKIFHNSYRMSRESPLQEKWHTFYLGQNNIQNY